MKKGLNREIARAVRSVARNDSQRMAKMMEGIVKRRIGGAQEIIENEC